jgi:hypothetical protein
MKPNSGGAGIDHSREKMMVQMGSFLESAMLKAKIEERKVAGDERAKKRQELKELVELKRMATSQDETAMYEDLIKAAGQEFAALIKADAAAAIAAAAQSAAAAAAAQASAAAVIRTPGGSHHQQHTQPGTQGHRPCSHRQGRRRQGRHRQGRHRQGLQLDSQ